MTPMNAGERCKRVGEREDQGLAEADDEQRGGDADRQLPQRRACARCA